MGASVASGRVRGPSEHEEEAPHQTLADVGPRGFLWEGEEWAAYAIAGALRFASQFSTAWRE